MWTRSWPNSTCLPRRPQIGLDGLGRSRVSGQPVVLGHGERVASPLLEDLGQALGEAILADAQSAGLGAAMFVSLGNKTDITGNDLLEIIQNQ